MKLQFDSIRGDILVIEAGDDLDIDEASPLLVQLERQAGRNLKMVVVDCSHVDFLHTPGISRLVDLHVRLTKRGGRLVICSLKQRIIDILEVLRLDRLLDVRDDLDSTLAMLREEPAA